MCVIEMCGKTKMKKNLKNLVILKITPFAYDVFSGRTGKKSGQKLTHENPQAGKENQGASPVHAERSHLS